MEKEICSEELQISKILVIQIINIKCCIGISYHERRDISLVLSEILTISHYFTNRDRNCVIENF